MAIDFRKPAHVIVVHGVQSGEDKTINCDDQILALLTRSLTENHIVDKKFEVHGYLYENYNDRAQRFYKLLAKALTIGRPLAGKVLKRVIDLVGDVVISASNSSTAQGIRRGLAKKIANSYDTGNQVVVVSHSLGTVYALQVVNELIRDRRYFNGDNMATWPIQGLVTLGSPLGLALEIAGIRIFEKIELTGVRKAQFSLFPWHNYFNRLDPIVSGNIFGKAVRIDISLGPIEKRYGPGLLNTNWKLRGHVVTSGEQWLFAHSTYWTDITLGDRLLDMLWG